MPSSKRQKFKVVLDTNVWVSAILWGGLPAKIVSLAEEKSIEIVLSEEILREINRILGYNHLREVYEQAGVSKDELMSIIITIGRLVDVVTRLNVVPEDDSDNRILECALNGDAEYVVTGDRHLLRLRNFKKVKILSVREFIRLTRKKPKRQG
ncbi:MAG: putative toxin-antitoxin system toxin component, PIN family [Nitrososphaerales archaeon]